MKFGVALFALAAIIGSTFMFAPSAPLRAEEPPPTGSPNFVVDYHRTGGFAGFDDRLLIDDDGNAVVIRRGVTTTFLLPPDVLDDLRARFNLAGFAELEPEYRPIGTVADGFIYTITYQGRTVITEGSAVPDQLWPVLTALNAIIVSTPM